MESEQLQFWGLFIGAPVIAYLLLSLLPRKAGIPLSLLAIALTLYALWVNVTDTPNSNYVDLGPYMRSVWALATLAGPLMALVFHLIGRRSWRWRLACFIAGFPLGFGLTNLYIQ